MGQGPGVLPAGGGQSPGALGPPRGGGYFEQALSALPHLPETRDTLAQAIDLRLALRSALRLLGDFGRILAYLREAESLAAALDDQHRLGQVSVYQSISSSGAHDQAIAAGQRALALATARGDAIYRRWRTSTSA